jgi:ArsR family transcriptional regulator, lead/cadmium/zinc/bismuth-responsive transcriptional repressor
MGKKICIRLMADPEQIESCRMVLKGAQPSFVRLSEVYSLLGNEARLKITCLLRQEKELCPCDLSDILEMSIPAVSQHLKKLKEGGLIDFRKEKQTVYYRLTEEAVAVLKPTFRQFGVLMQQTQIL